MFRFGRILLWADAMCFAVPGKDMRGRLTWSFPGSIDCLAHSPHCTEGVEGLVHQGLAKSLNPTVTENESY